MPVNPRKTTRPILTSHPYVRHEAEADAVSCRFIVKQLQASEKRSMQEITPSYFRYLAHVTRKSAPTCLAKIMGIYTVCLCSSPDRSPVASYRSAHASAVAPAA